MIGILIVALSLGIPITMGLVLGAIIVGIVEQDRTSGIPYRRALLGLIGVVGIVLILTGCPCDEEHVVRAETETSTSSESGIESSGEDTTETGRDEAAEGSNDLKYDIGFDTSTPCPPACEPPQ